MTPKCALHLPASVRARLGAPVAVLEHEVALNPALPSGLDTANVLGVTSE